jgi:CBS domain-containing protein
MKVEDVMTRDLITVAPGASIHAAARLMVDHGVSGLPVVDDGGRLVGMLSEGDLILRQKPRSWPRWWHLFFDDGERLAREYRKATGVTVGEVMTAPVICVSPEAPLASAASLLAEHGIRRLPVVSGGALVGIVSRADLIKALAAAPEAGETPSDAQLVAEMKRRLAREAWTSERQVVVEAHDGVLDLWGPADSDAEREALETMARSIPGCRGVDSHVVVRPESVARYGAY